MQFFRSCGVCSGRGQSYSILAQPLEWSYFLERIIPEIVCLCCGLRSSNSIATLMNESCRDFILSMSMSLPGYLVGKVRIS